MCLWRVTFLSPVAVTFVVPLVRPRRTDEPTLVIVYRYNSRDTASDCVWNHAGGLHRRGQILEDITYHLTLGAESPSEPS